jgi:hypothetical protein
MIIGPTWSIPVVPSQRDVQTRIKGEKLVFLRIFYSISLFYGANVRVGTYKVQIGGE